MVLLRRAVAPPNGGGSDRSRHRGTFGVGSDLAEAPNLAVEDLARMTGARRERRSQRKTPANGGKNRTLQVLTLVAP